MNKQSYIGLALIFAIMMAFYWINKPNELQRQRWQAYHDSLARVEAQKNDSLSAAAALSQREAEETDSVAIEKRNAKYGLLAESATGKAEKIVVENQNLKVTFTTEGARVYSVEVKGYKDQEGNNVKLFDGEGNEFGFHFVHNNRTFYTNNLFFQSSGVTMDADSTQRVSFIVNAGEGSLVYEYALKNESYELDFNISSKGLGDVVSVSGAAFELDWKVDMRAQEKGHKSEGMWSGVYYRYNGGDVEDLGATGKQSQEENMSIDWVAFKDQFFSSIFVADNTFAGALMNSEARAETDSIIKHVEASLGVKYNFYQDSKASFKFLFVPNYYYTLNSYDGLELTELLPLGWGIFGWVNEWFIIPVFKLLENYFTSYGIIILLLTIIIKTILMPLMYKSYKSQAKMRVLKPQVDEITAKIPESDPMARQKATMELYNKAGVNQMAGCLPMLLQMPILFAAFRFFPAAIELRGESFLWAEDLATYDSIWDMPFSIPFYGSHVSLFCLLMAIVNVVYTKINMSSQGSAAMPGMKMMTYFMPIMMLFFLNDYPAGLNYYYFISTLITVLSTTFIKSFMIDDKAILAQLEANKKKPMKKSKWAMKMEEIMKEQEKARRMQKK
ncbi:MAG: membrane protein insertase YidC [Bacteroidales bacterium]|nr:membrane protein insertase YidC [Bacteroidales bacterium]